VRTETCNGWASELGSLECVQTLGVGQAWGMGGWRGCGAGWG